MPLHYCCYCYSFFAAFFFFAAAFFSFFATESVDDEEDDEVESSEEEEFSEEEDDEEEDDEDIFEEDEWIMEKAPLHEIVSQEYMESQFRCTVCRSLGSEFLDCRVCVPALGAKYMNKLNQDEIDEYMQMTWDEHNLLMDGFT